MSNIKIPEKWQVKVTPENCDVLYTYWKTVCTETGWDFPKDSNWILSDSFYCDSMMCWVTKGAFGYTEITFEEFKEIVNITFMGRKKFQPLQPGRFSEKIDVKLESDWFPKLNGFDETYQEHVTFLPKLQKPIQF
jgi:hypothetical protein